MQGRIPTAGTLILHTAVMTRRFLVAVLALLPAACSQYQQPPPLLPPHLEELYGVDPVFKALYMLDSKLGVHTVVGSPGPGRLDAPSAMATRPADSELFVYNNAPEAELRQHWGLVRLDRCSGFATRIGPQAQARITMGALAFSPQGRLYGFGETTAGTGEHSTLFSIDPDSGDYSPIGSVSLSGQYSITAADFHPDGDLYAVGTIGTDEQAIQMLLIIDTETGRPSIVGELNRYVGDVTSIVFGASGALLGAGTNANGERFLFEIELATGDAAAIRRSTVAPTGLGYAPPISC